MRGIRLLTVAGAVLALSCGPLAAVDQTQTKPAATTQPANSAPNADPYGTFPLRERRAVPGRAVGVLVSDSSRNLSVRETTLSSGYVFALGDSQYRQFLWHTADVKKGQTLQEPVSQRGDGGFERREFKSICLADLDSGKEYGVKPPFSVVELEVDEGLGCPIGIDFFVATRVKVIHGTVDCPLDPERVWNDSSERFEKYKADKKGTIQLAFLVTAPKALGQKLTGPTVTREHAFITWLPESQRVRIAFQTVTTDGAYAVTPAREMNGHGEMPPTRIPAFRTGPQYGIEASLILEYAKDGTIVSENPQPLKDFTRQFSEELPERGR